MATQTQTLTDDQRAAISKAGAEVAEGWRKACPEVPASELEDYDFAGTGDWEHVRDAARSVGIDWEGTQPPSDVRAEVWTVAQDGFRAAL